MKKKIIQSCFFLSVFLVFMLSVLNGRMSAAEGADSSPGAVSLDNASQENKNTEAGTGDIHKHETITVEGSTYYFNNFATWKYQFSDDYFFLPSDQYHHSLAKVSAGLALSSARVTEREGNQGECVVNFLRDMGFVDIDAHTYDKKSTKDSIALAIARKKVDDLTVICLAVCGNNYGVEWASNVTVGDDLLSEGFADGAGKALNELDAYLDRYPVEGKAKMWITGYSRGGAVADIVAARCTDSGRFQDVYAYTFAAPRHTRNPGQYRNIFNVIRQEDVVPKIPPPEWGYQRYGVDLPIVSPDTDIDCTEIIKRSAELYQEMIGAEMTTNLDINYHLRCILDYILYLMPDSASYTRLLQPVLYDLITADEDFNASLESFLQAMTRFGAENKEQEAELKELIDYLETLVHLYAFQGKAKTLPANMWDPALGAFNWFSDHLQFKYLANMFSTENPEELFTDNAQYIRLVIGGAIDAEIYDGDTLIKTVKPKEIRKAPGSGEEDDQYPRVQVKGTKMVINLPADQSYRIEVKSRAYLPQVIAYSGNLYTSSSVRAKTDPFYFKLLGPGEMASIVTSGEDQVIDREESDFTGSSKVLGERYSPSVAITMEEEKIVHLTMDGVITFLFYLTVFLVIQIVVSVILALVRWKNGRERNTVVIAVWHGIDVVLFVFCEMAAWFFIPTMPHLKLIPMVLALLILLDLAWKLYRKNKNPNNYRLFLVYTAALVAFGLLNAFLAGGFSPVKAVLLLLLYSLFFAGPLELFQKKNALTEPRRMNTRQDG